MVPLVLTVLTAILAYPPLKAEARPPVGVGLAHSGALRVVREQLLRLRGSVCLLGSFGFLHALVLPHSSSMQIAKTLATHPPTSNPPEAVIGRRRITGKTPREAPAPEELPSQGMSAVTTVLHYHDMGSTAPHGVERHRPTHP